MAGERSEEGEGGAVGTLSTPPHSFLSRMDREWTLLQGSAFSTGHLQFLGLSVSARVGVGDQEWVGVCQWFKKNTK